MCVRVYVGVCNCTCVNMCVGANRCAICRHQSLLSLCRSDNLIIMAPEHDFLCIKGSHACWCVQLYMCQYVCRCKPLCYLQTSVIAFYISKRQFDRNGP